MTEQEAIEQFKERLSIEEYRHQIPEYYEAMELAVKSLEEIQQYRAIGTPEECRAAVEKQIAKKPREYEDKFYGCCLRKCSLTQMGEKYPTKLMNKKNGLPYCLGCGQKLDWSDE